MSAASSLHIAFTVGTFRRMSARSTMSSCTSDAVCTDSSDSADAPAEAAIAVRTRDRARCPLVVVRLPVGERRAQVDAAPGVEVGVVLLRLGAHDEVLGLAEARGATGTGKLARAIATGERRVLADGHRHDA